MITRDLKKINKRISQTSLKFRHKDHIFLAARPNGRCPANLRRRQHAREYVNRSTSTKWLQTQHLMFIGWVSHRKCDVPKCWENTGVSIVCQCHVLRPLLLISQGSAKFSAHSAQDSHTLKQQGSVSETDISKALTVNLTMMTTLIWIIIVLNAVSQLSSVEAHELEQWYTELWWTQTIMYSTVTSEERYNCKYERFT